MQVDSPAAQEANTDSLLTTDYSTPLEPRFYAASVQFAPLVDARQT